MNWICLIALLIQPSLSSNVDILDKNLIELSKGLLLPTVENARKGEFDKLKETLKDYKVDDHEWPNRIFTLNLVPGDLDQLAQKELSHKDAIIAARSLIQVKADLEALEDILQVTHNSTSSSSKRLQSNSIIDPNNVKDQQIKAFINLARSDDVKGELLDNYKALKAKDLISISKRFLICLLVAKAAEDPEQSVLWDSFTGIDNEHQIPIDVLQERLLDWRLKVFTSDTPSRERKELAAKVDKALATTYTLSKREENPFYLMNLAYQERVAGNVTIAFRLIAAIITLVKDPPESLFQYYKSLEKDHLSSELVDILINSKNSQLFSLTAEQSRIHIEKAGELAKEFDKLKSILYFEGGTEFKEIIFSKGSSRATDWMKKMNAHALKSNEQEHRPFPVHTVKYLVNQFYHCALDTPQYSCWLFLCAAGQRQSKLKETTTFWCHRYLKKHAAWNNIPAGSDISSSLLLYLDYVMTTEKIKDEKQYTLELVKRLSENDN